MSVVIEVSYQHDEELTLILDRLEDLSMTVSNRDYKAGRFRRCYLKSKKRLTREAPADDPLTEYPSA